MGIGKFYLLRKGSGVDLMARAAGVDHYISSSGTEGEARREAVAVGASVTTLKTFSSPPTDQELAEPPPPEKVKEAKQSREQDLFKRAHELRGLEGAEQSGKTGETILPFGKYRGKTLSQVPKGYLNWMLDQADQAAWAPAITVAVRAYIKQLGGK